MDCYGAYFGAKAALSVYIGPIIVGCVPLLRELGVSG